MHLWWWQHNKKGIWFLSGFDSSPWHVYIRKRLENTIKRFSETTRPLPYILSGFQFSDCKSRTDIQMNSKCSNQPLLVRRFQMRCITGHVLAFTTKVGLDHCTNNWKADTRQIHKESIANVLFELRKEVARHHRGQQSYGRGIGRISTGPSSQTKSSQLSRIHWLNLSSNSLLFSLTLFVNRALDFMFRLTKFAQV